MLSSPLVRFASRFDGRHRRRRRGQLPGAWPGVRRQHDRERRLSRFLFGRASGSSASSFVVALAGFSVGSIAGGRLARAREADRRIWLTLAFTGETVLVTIALVVSAFGGTHSLGGGDLYAAVALLAAGMGIQNATARALAVPDLTTTVLTLTLTGSLGGLGVRLGRANAPGRRIASVVAMLAGAAVGAVLVLDASVPAALGLAAGALALWWRWRRRQSAAPGSPKGRERARESHNAGGEAEASVCLVKRTCLPGAGCQRDRLAGRPLQENSCKRAKNGPRSSVDRAAALSNKHRLSFCSRCSIHSVSSAAEPSATTELAEHCGSATARETG